MSSPIEEASPDKRVDVLISMREGCIGQLAEIKRDEAGWLKVFIAFYGAIIFWLASSWLNQDPGGLPSLGTEYSAYLLSAIIVVSWLGTAAFGYLFLRTRWSYYSVMLRFMLVEQALQTNDGNIWGGCAPSKGGYSMGAAGTAHEWRVNTQVTNSFLTRMVYVIGGNFAVNFAGVFAFNQAGVVTNDAALVLFVVLFLVGNIALTAVILSFDFLHFLREDRKRRQGEAQGP
jgi:hypothetical protein